MASLLLQDIPKDVETVIQREQEKIKKKKAVKVYSKEMTVYSIIKQFANKCQEKE